MIIETHSDREYEDTLEPLRIINLLRARGPGDHPPNVEDTDWVKTRRAYPRYR